MLLLTDTPDGETLIVVFPSCIERVPQPTDTPFSFCGTWYEGSETWPPFTTNNSFSLITENPFLSFFSVDAAIASLLKLRFPAFFLWKTYSVYGMLAENGDTFFCRPFGLPRHTSCWPWSFRGSGAFLFGLGKVSRPSLSTPPILSPHPPPVKPFLPV